MRNTLILCILLFTILSLTSCSNLSTEPEKLNGTPEFWYLLTYHVPEAGHVKYYIKDINNELIRTLVDDYQVISNYGVYWYKVDKNNNLVPSGIYYLVLEVNGKSMINQMLYVKY